MTTRSLCIASVLAFSVAGISHGDSFFTGWEDTSAPELLGSYNNLESSGYNTEDPYAGNSCLTMEEAYDNSGTPQGYGAWITGLSEGDTITVSAWMKGEYNNETTSSSNEWGKGRLWGHYTSSEDITAYDGSASGPSGYAGIGGVWTETTHMWTVAAGKTAMVVELRMYCYGDARTLLVDNLSVTVSNASATVSMAGIPAPGGLALLGIAGIASRRRRA